MRLAVHFGLLWLILGAYDDEIQGKLAFRDGAPLLESRGDSIPVSGGTESLQGTLNDVRLKGRELKLKGRRLANGRFEAHDLYVVRPGGLFRIIYFCRICNITTFSPGICSCCQQPTLPVEVPLNDPRVYQEK